MFNNVIFVLHVSLAKKMKRDKPLFPPLPSNGRSKVSMKAASGRGNLIDPTFLYVYLFQDGGYQSNGTVSSHNNPPIETASKVREMCMIIYHIFSFHYSNTRLLHLAFYHQVSEEDNSLLIVDNHDL